MEQKNLIMGTISYYRWEDIKPFFKSLEKTGFSGEVTIFIEYVDEKTKKRLKNLNYKVNMVPFQRVGLEKIFIINDYRYYLYHNFLNENSDRYNNILLTDVRDVYFQADPFNANWSSDAITVAKECLNVSDEFWNTKWILKKYGSHIYSSLQDKTILCSGTTFGSAILISQYINKMVESLFYGEYHPMSDQAVHNYLIYSRKIEPVIFADNYQGPIMTLGLENEWNIKINQDRKVLLNNGDVAPILHQYDRKEFLKNLLKDEISS
jgi:hypothetical protein